MKETQAVEILDIVNWNPLKDYQKVKVKLSSLSAKQKKYLGDTDLYITIHIVRNWKNYEDTQIYKYVGCGIY